MSQEIVAIGVVVAYVVVFFIWCYLYFKYSGRGDG